MNEGRKRRERENILDYVIQCTLFFPQMSDRKRPLDGNGGGVNKKFKRYFLLFTCILLLIGSTSDASTTEVSDTSLENELI